jgi:hypothetical protein
MSVPTPRIDHGVGQHTAVKNTMLSVRIHSFTIYRRSWNPSPSKIAGIAFSIRAVRVRDCFALAK